LGFYISHKIDLIWWTRTENKCKFFAWVLIQNKLVTTENLARRGWTHQPSCALCNGPIESGLHLCLTCSFAQEVWNTVLAWESFCLSQQVDLCNISNIREWWEKTETLFPIAKGSSIVWSSTLCGTFGRSAIEESLSVARCHRSRS
jgi:hypothetical protein